MQEEKEKHPGAVAMGKLRVAKLTKEEWSEHCKRAINARWEKYRKAQAKKERRKMVKDSDNE